MENQNPEVSEKNPDEKVTPAVSAPVQTDDGLIAIDQFMQVNLRVAEVQSVEAIPKSKKLLKLQVSLGEELGTRQILAGVAPYFEDIQTLVGRKIVVVANLKPAKLMGHESQGMLLAAATADGTQLNLLDPGDLPAGSQVR